MHTHTFFSRTFWTRSLCAVAYSCGLSTALVTAGELNDASSRRVPAAPQVRAAVSGTNLAQARRPVILSLAQQTANVRATVAEVVPYEELPNHTATLRELAAHVDPNLQPVVFLEELPHQPVGLEQTGPVFPSGTIDLTGCAFADNDAPQGRALVRWEPQRRAMTCPAATCPSTTTITCPSLEMTVAAEVIVEGATEATVCQPCTAAKACAASKACDAAKACEAEKACVAAQPTTTPKLLPDEPAAVILDMMRRFGNTLQGTEFAKAPACTENAAAENVPVDVLVEYIRQLETEPAATTCRPAKLEPVCSEELPACTAVQAYPANYPNTGSAEVIRLQAQTLRMSSQQVELIANQLEEQGLYDQADALRGQATLLRHDARDLLDPKKQLLEPHAVRVITPATTGVASLSQVKYEVETTSGQYTHEPVEPNVKELNSKTLNDVKKRVNAAESLLESFKAWKKDHLGVDEEAEANQEFRGSRMFRR